MIMVGESLPPLPPLTARFIPAIPPARVRGDAALGELETPHGFQLSLVILLAPHQDGTSNVASSKCWGAKSFDVRRMTLFCLGYRLSKHKMTICSKHFVGGHSPLWLRLWMGPARSEMSHSTLSLVNRWGAFPRV